MQSSYNVIKNNYVISNGNKEIVTNASNIYSANNSNDEEIEVYENENEINKENEAHIKALIEEAQKQAEEILANANYSAENIKKEAYEGGYEQGSLRGYEDAYEKTLTEARAEAEKIIANANKLLLNANFEYQKYIEDKKKELILLTTNIAEKILKNELSQKDGLDEIILDALKDSKNAESFIIKANEVHCEEIRTHVVEWKSSLGLKSDIFVISDENLGPYDAVIEKNNGRIELGLEAGMEGIRRVLI